MGMLLLVMEKGQFQALPLYRSHAAVAKFSHALPQDQLCQRKVLPPRGKLRSCLTVLRGI